MIYSRTCSLCVCVCVCVFLGSVSGAVSHVLKPPFPSRSTETRRTVATRRRGGRNVILGAPGIEKTSHESREREGDAPRLKKCRCRCDFSACAESPVLIGSHSDLPPQYPGVKMMRYEQKVEDAHV